MYREDRWRFRDWDFGVWKFREVKWVKVDLMRLNASFDANVEAKSDLYRDVSIWNFNVGKKVILENFVRTIFDYEMFRAKCKSLMQTVIYIEIQVLIWNFVNAQEFCFDQTLRFKFIYFWNLRWKFKEIYKRFVVKRVKFSIHRLLERKIRIELE